MSEFKYPEVKKGMVRIAFLVAVGSKEFRTQVYRNEKGVKQEAKAFRDVPRQLAENILSKPTSKRGNSWKTAVPFPGSDFNVAIVTDGKIANESVLAEQFRKLEEKVSTAGGGDASGLEKKIEDLHDLVEKLNLRIDDLEKANEVTAETKTTAKK